MKKVFAIIMSLLVIAGCTINQSINKADPNEYADNSYANVRIALNNTVYIESVHIRENSNSIIKTGSGVLISDKGHIITNEHVVGDVGPINASFTYGPLAGRTFPLIRVHINESLDYAILRVMRSPNIMEPILSEFEHPNLSTETQFIGQEVFTVGFPNAVLNIDYGVLLNYMEDSGSYRVNVHVASGASGSGLFNRRNGELIGIVRAIEVDEYRDSDLDIIQHPHGNLLNFQAKAVDIKFVCRTLSHINN